YVSPIGRYVASILMSGFCFWNVSNTDCSCGLPWPFDCARTLSVTVACVCALTLTATASARAATAATAVEIIVQRRGEDCFPFTGSYLLDVRCVGRVTRPA